MARGSLNLNVLATYSGFLGRVFGCKLLTQSETMARGAARHTISLIAADTDSPALRLYQSIGYREVAQGEFARDDWHTDANH
ncbi:MAG: hypothetical protein WCS20_10610 [Alphaproteobacteria bacterium]